MKFKYKSEIKNKIFKNHKMKFLSLRIRIKKLKRKLNKRIKM